MSVEVSPFFADSYRLCLSLETYQEIHKQLELSNGDVEKIIAARVHSPGLHSSKKEELKKVVSEGIQELISLANLEKEEVSQKKIRELLEDKDSGLEWDYKRQRTCDHIEKCVAIFAYTFGKEIAHTKKNDVYTLLHSMLGELEFSDFERQSYAARFEGIEITDLKTILEKLDKIQFSNRLTFVKEEEPSRRLQKTVLAVINLDIPKTAPVSEIINWIHFIGDFVSSEKMQLYISGSDGAIFHDLYPFIRQLYDSVHDQVIHICTMTSSDYDGQFTRGIWHSNLLSFQGHARVRCRQMVEFVSEFAKIADKYIANVQLHHFLPSFEEPSSCYDEKLRESLGRIRSLYSREVHVFLSREWLEDDLFQKKKEDIMRRGEHIATTQGLLQGTKLSSESYPRISNKELAHYLGNGVSECMTVKEILVGRSNTVFLSPASNVLAVALAASRMPFLAGRIKKEY